MNTTTVVGRIGSVEVKDITQDAKVIKLSVAESYSEKSPSGEWERKTNWFNVDYVVSKKYKDEFIKKGMIVAVTGSLKSREFESKTYWTLKATDLIAEETVKRDSGSSENNSNNLP